MAVCVVSAIAGANLLGYKSLGIAMAVGILLCAPSDIPGNIRHRYKGMLIAIVLNMSVTLIARLTADYFIINTLVVTLLCFIISFLSVYGFRASLIAFSGLLATVLSFGNFPVESIWLFAAFIGVGGGYYLLFSSLFIYFQNKNQVDTQLGDTANLTADLLSCRLKLLQENSGEREKNQQEQVKLQNRINEKHEDIRTTLLSFRRKSGLSHSARRKLLAFIILVDNLELALSHPVDFDEIDRLRNKFPALFDEFTALLQLIIAQMRSNAAFLKDGELPRSQDDLKAQLTSLKKRLNSCLSTAEPLETARLKNLFAIEKKQVTKLRSMARVIDAIVSKNRVSFKTHKYRKFLTPEDYSIKIFTENFNRSSAIFRHALRLSLLFVLGLGLGYVFELQKSYWILLTLIVIMRPNYGLTKERTKKRIVGTLLGALIAMIIILTVSTPAVFAVLAILSLIVGFSMIQENYAGAAAFITLTVLMSYALLALNAYEIVQYRVLDTLIGAGLAVLANYFLWPAWEYRNIPKLKKESIEANRDFLTEIDAFYRKKGRLPLSYKLARKKAFLKLGELSAACQRMSQEPKSKQKSFEELYDFTTLNHTMLSSLASLGTFIRHNRTTQPSAAFDRFTNVICGELNSVISENDETKTTENDDDQLDSLQRDLFQKATGDFNREEAQLISDQLSWLYRLSQQIKKNFK